MERVVTVYIITLGFMLATAIYWVLRSDQSIFRKYVRIRVRTDENRRQRLSEPGDEDFEAKFVLEWLVVGIVLLLAFMALVEF